MITKTMSLATGEDLRREEKRREEKRREERKGRTRKRREEKRGERVVLLFQGRRV